jgi:hypothetical protein
VVGSLAVLITLIYVAVQVRQVKNDLHISGYREVNRFFAETSATVTPELAQVLAKLEQREDLEAWEKILRDEYFFRFMNTLEVAWEHMRAKTMDISEETVMATIWWFLQKPGLEQWWNENRDGYLDHWKELVDGIYDQAKAKARDA